MRLEKNTTQEVTFAPHVLVNRLKIVFAILLIAYHRTALVPLWKKVPVVNIHVLNLKIVTNLVVVNMTQYVDRMVKLTQIHVNLKMLNVKTILWKC